MLTSPASAKVSLLFTSDEHGYITRQSKLQHEVDRTRQNNPDGTLLISCGDMFEGSAENGVLGVEASRKMLELAGYDLITVGNHDFDRGPQVAREWVEKAPCDVVCSNLKDKGTGELLTHSSASKVYELNGVKMGLIGATTQESITILPKAKLEGLTIEDPTAAVQVEVEKLKAQGVELIGLISHLGLPTDRKMADAVPELDFILGGHTHDSLEVPEKRGQTLIMHPGSFRKGIGHLDLHVDPATGQIHNVDYKLIQGETQEEDHGNVGHLAEEYKASVNDAMGQVVARMPAAVDYDPNVLGEAMETVLAQAVKAKTGADIVMINQKGLRAGLPAGDVKVGDVYNVFPFDNQLVTVDMKASDVLALLNESYRRNDQTSFTLGFEDKVQYASNLRTHEPMLVADTSADRVPEGYTALPSSSPDHVSSVPPADASIKVATIDWLLEGGLGYFKPGEQKIEGDFGSLRDALEEHLSKTYPA